MPRRLQALVTVSWILLTVGAGALAQQPVYYTPAPGAPVTSAPSAPALQSTRGGTLAQTTYYVKVSYTSPGGETARSPESMLRVGAGNLLVVVSPPAATSATGWNVYVSTSGGREARQNGSTPLAIGTIWIEPASGLAGVAAAAADKAKTGRPVSNPGSDPNVMTSGGTIGSLPYFDTSTPSSDIASSVVYQSSGSMAAPGAPGLVPGMIGSLGTGTYYYEVTALDSAGTETKGGAEASVNVPSSYNSVSVTWMPVAGAASYRVYRGTSSGGENTYYSVSGISYTDTGATGTLGTPPTSSSAKVATIGSSASSWLLGPGVVITSPTLLGTAYASGAFSLSVGPPYTPTRDAYVIWAQDNVTGSLPTPPPGGGYTFAGLNGQINTTGWLTAAPSGDALVGIEGVAAIESAEPNPVTLPEVRAGTFNINTASGSTTNITNARVLAAQGITKSGSGTITNDYGLYVDDQTSGSNNWAIKTNAGLVEFGGNLLLDSGSITAGGSNQNITLTPSGTGYTLLGGNVGVGTTSPGSALQVGAGTALSVNGVVPQINNVQTSGQAALGLLVNDGINNPRASLFVDNTNGVWGLYSTFHATGIPFTLSQGGSEVFRITNSGKVGIGTTSPGYALDVSGDINSSGTYRISGTQIAASNLSNGATGTAGSAIVLASSPTMTTPSVTQINDGNGNPFIKSSATASAVDSISVTNAATANPATVNVGASGTDTNITLELDAKGTGDVRVQLANIGTTPTVGEQIRNSTAATSGVQVQYSPGLRFTGSAWNTAGSGSSKNDSFLIYSAPISGNPTSGALNFDAAPDQGGFSTVASLTTAGSFQPKTLAAGIVSQKYSVAGASPYFDLSAGNTQQYVCDATSGTHTVTPTFINLTQGEFVTVIFVQGSSATCSVTWPNTGTVVHGGMTISNTQSNKSVNVQQFVVSYNATDLYAVTPGYTCANSGTSCGSP